MKDNSVWRKTKKNENSFWEKRRKNCLFFFRPLSIFIDFYSKSHHPCRKKKHHQFKVINAWFEQGVSVRWFRCMEKCTVMDHFFSQCPYNVCWNENKRLNNESVLLDGVYFVQNYVVLCYSIMIWTSLLVFKADLDYLWLLGRFRILSRHCSGSETIMKHSEKKKNCYQTRSNRYAKNLTKFLWVLS